MNYAGKLIIFKISILHIMFINLVDKIFDNFGENWKLLDNKTKERKPIHINQFISIKVNYAVQTMNESTWHEPFW